MRTLSLLLLLLPSVAAADTVAIPHPIPSTLRVFTKAQYIDETGRSKESCADAVADGMASVEKTSGKWKMDTVVAYVGGKELAPIAETECEAKGKNFVVKLEAVAVQQGTTGGYTNTTGERTLEIVRGILAGNFNVKGQLASMAIEEARGALYLRLVPGSHSDTFQLSDNSNDRAVVVFRSEVIPQVRAYTPMITPLGELTGIAAEISASRLNKQAETESERWRFELPTEAMNKFVAGEITEQALIDAGAVFRDGVRADVKMTAADD